MKNIIKNNLAYKAAILTVFLLFTTCDKSIDIIGGNEEAYQTSDNAFAYIINEEGKRSSSFVEFRNEGTTNVYVALSKGVESEVTAALKYSKSALEAYNQAQQTDYEAFPQELIEFTGEPQIAKEKLKSNKVSIQLKTSDALDSQKTYVIPLSFELTSNNIKRSETNANYLIFVKDLSKIPNATKIPDPSKYPAGIKIVSCMEVNDANPLNNLCFRLKKSGKPLVDMVILFSANINYNPDTGRVYVFSNENVQHLLDNREKYIKPLQDRGIKVVLSILGNHDQSGIANLSDETAKEFAQELKAVCSAYDLDGVFFDDEYSVYKSPPPIGFVIPSSQAAARLFYETKRTMPDRLVTTYVYSRTSYLPAVDGHSSGNFVDYALHDYLKGYDLSKSYPDIPKSGMGLYSQEFARGYYATAQNLQSLRQGGYGAHMIFAMDPTRSDFTSQKTAMQLIAKELFDDELEIYGADGVKMDQDHIDQNKFYKKDWE